MTTQTQPTLEDTVRLFPQLTQKQRKPKQSRFFDDAYMGTLEKFVVRIYTKEKKKVVEGINRIFLDYFVFFILFL